MWSDGGRDGCSLFWAVLRELFANPADRLGEVTRSLTEFGDFECPYCGKAYPTIKRLRERLGDRVVFEFRHFPVSDKHPHAERAAEAAEAARAQGRFEAMHDQLFEHQKALEDEDLAAYAEAIGLDMERFHADMATRVHLSAILADRAAGEALGITGTPGFAIDGKRYTGFYDLDALLDELE
jgi:protein-disulfide isomerase